MKGNAWPLCGRCGADMSHQRGSLGPVCECGGLPASRTPEMASFARAFTVGYRYARRFGGLLLTLALQRRPWLDPETYLAGAAQLETDRTNRTVRTNAFHYRGGVYRLDLPPA